MQEGKGRPARKRGRAKGKTVCCRLNLPADVAAKLYWLAKVNKVGFPDGLPELVERYHRGTLLACPEKVGSPAAR